MAPPPSTSGEPETPTAPEPAGKEKITNAGYVIEQAGNGGSDANARSGNSQSPHSQVSPRKRAAIVALRLANPQQPLSWRKIADQLGIPKSTANDIFNHAVENALAKRRRLSLSSSPAAAAAAAAATAATATTAATDAGTEKAKEGDGEVTLLELLQSDCLDPSPRSGRPPLSADEVARRRKAKEEQAAATAGRRRGRTTMGPAGSASVPVPTAQTAVVVEQRRKKAKERRRAAATAKRAATPPVPNSPGLVGVLAPAAAAAAAATAAAATATAPTPATAPTASTSTPVATPVATRPPLAAGETAVQGAVAETRQRRSSRNISSSGKEYGNGARKNTPRCRC